VRGQLQQGEIDQLSARLAELRQAVEERVHDEYPSTIVEPTAPARPVRLHAGDDDAAGSGSRGADAQRPSRSAIVPAERWTERTPEAVHDELIRILDSEDPEVRSRVRDMVVAAEEGLRDERREQRQQRWEARSLERLGQLAQEVSLTAHQQDALFAILTVARDRAADAFRQGREGGDIDQARAQARKAHDEASGEARELLDDKQFQAFSKMLEQERPGRRGRQRQER
jgi:hypothetical protein